MIIRITASNWSRSASYIAVSDAANMYDDAEDTSNYASIRGREGRSSNTTHFLYLYGWDLSQIPTDAVINSFAVKIRCRCNAHLDAGSAYRMKLCSQPGSSYRIANTEATSSISTTTALFTFPLGNITWNDIVSYGSLFSIEIPLRNTSTSSTVFPYVYVYGAEIEVDYTPGNIYSNYYIMTSYGGWSPCIEGNNAHGLRPFSGSVLPNCSGFATGRFNERLGLNACIWLGSYNGGEFISVAMSQGLGTGWDPVPGAILVWGDPGEEGHVAVVEQVIDNDNIITSESGWNYTVEPIVRTVNRTRGANGRWGYSQECKGFAYPPGVPGQYVDYYMLFLEDE